MIAAGPRACKQHSWQEVNGKHLILPCGQTEELQVGTQVTQMPIMEALRGNKGIG